MSKLSLTCEINLPGEVNTNDLVNRVKEILPINSSEYKILNVEGTNTKFKARVKANLKSEADVDLFINYGQKNNETLRILKTKKSVNENANTLVKYFRCHHNTRHEATKRPGEVLASKPTWRFKNTNCPFSMVVRISRDAEHEDFPSTIYVEWSHNHSV